MLTLLITYLYIEVANKILLGIYIMHCMFLPIVGYVQNTDRCVVISWLGLYVFIIVLKNNNASLACSACMWWAIVFYVKIHTIMQCTYSFFSITYWYFYSDVKLDAFYLCIIQALQSPLIISIYLNETTFVFDISGWWGIKTMQHRISLFIAIRVAPFRASRFGHTSS